MKTLLSTAAALALLGAATVAQAQEYTPKHAGLWVVDARVTGVVPDESGSIMTAGGVDTGLDVDIGDSYVPTLGITYFATDNVAIDVTLGTSRHQISAVAPGTDVEVHNTWVVPPVVTLQYHFQPEARFSPYVGAGVNAMIFYNGDDQNGFTVDLDNGVGGAVQVGFDYALQGPWTFNADVKKVWFDTDASINGGTLRSDVSIDPWVVSLGFGRRF
jgi:outer membrane protein